MCRAGNSRAPRSEISSGNYCKEQLCLAASTYHLISPEVHTISEMPLYKDVLFTSPGEASKQSELDREKSQQQVSNVGLKLLQSHLISKKRAKQTQIQPNKLIKTSEKIQQSVPHWTIDEEYDPMTPNSYEILQLAHIKAEERRLALRKSGPRINLSILDALDQLDDPDNSCPSGPRSTQGAAIAPPPILHSTIASSTQPDSSKVSAQTYQTSSEKLEGRSAAAKIMAKMGYKSGEGLGKDNQGISAPLEVETSSTNIARIVQKETSIPANEKQEPMFTRVLLLQNMVGPGEVDDELETETKEECTKYGQVLKCLIYEIPNKRVPDDEAVRIFVEFKDAESTGKAIGDLNGRYFGGRVVKATCYDENKFNRYELAS